MKPIYIFDLDGTLADVSHRRHFLNKEDSTARFSRPSVLLSKIDWKSFYSHCDKDLPVKSVISTMERLRLTCDIYIFSGRSDEVRYKTVIWLAEHTSFMSHDFEKILIMRQEGDYTPDDELKIYWYHQLCEKIPNFKERLVGVFDDRNKVVKAWRSLGVTCFQVAEGEF